MMRIGILSDTHDQVARTARAVSMLVAEGAEALIHCGDLTGPSIVYQCGLLPSYYVFGNNDFEEDALKRAIALMGGTCLEFGGQLELGGRRIAVTHGDSNREVRRLLSSTPHYLLLGHSHVPSDERHSATRWINPGALHRSQAWTVALLDVVTDSLRFLEIS
jgi:uncharacterized protein